CQAECLRCGSWGGLTAPPRAKGMAGYRVAARAVAAVWSVVEEGALRPSRNLATSGWDAAAGQLVGARLVHFLSTGSLDGQVLHRSASSSSGCRWSVAGWVPR